MYWEGLPDSSYGLGIVHQPMTRERFKFISNHLACADHDELDKMKQLEVRNDLIQKIRLFVDVLNKNCNECRTPPAKHRRENGKVQRSIYAPTINEGKTNQKAASESGVHAVEEATPISLKSIMSLRFEKR